MGGSLHAEHADAQSWRAAGVTSQVAEVQALALTTLAKIVAAAGADRIRPHLPELVPALLEALSGLEVCSLPARPFPFL